MAAAPDGDGILTPSDAVDVLEELLDAQNHSYVLGLKLKLPISEVESIHSTHKKPRDRLLQVLIAFLNGVEPPPSWRVLVDALNNPVVNLTHLAQRVKRAHFPDLASSSNVEPETSDEGGVSVNNLDICSVVSPQPSCVAKVRGEIKEFHGRFNSLKVSTIRCLEKLRITVKTVVFFLTAVLSLREHKDYLEEKHQSLHRCEDHWELFGMLNFYWSYLAYDLLDQLLEQLTLKEASFCDAVRQMAEYKIDLQKFRERTTLAIFCQAEPHREDDPPPNFRKMVVKHMWPETITLEDVEMFRKCYTQEYNLPTCAMMLHSIKHGSFTITWFVTVTVIELLMKDQAVKLYKEFNITRLDIAEICVYLKEHKDSTLLTPLTFSTEPFSQRFEITTNESPLEQECSFVEQPSQEYFCPVTFGLLHHPHLTSCCGKHLSEEAVTRIQRENGICPLCKAPQFATVLNKHFQRQVLELSIFCHYKDKGCDWQGALSELERHIQHCAKGNQDQCLKHEAKLLQTKERELALAQQKINEMKQWEAELLQCKQHELAEVQQQLRQKEELLKSAEALLDDLRLQITKFASDNCQVSGPGLRTATVHHSTHVLVELNDASCRPFSIPQNITAQLELASEAILTTSLEGVHETCLEVIILSSSQYKVLYTAAHRGHHKLHIQVNRKEINGSPFDVIVYPDPSQLNCPVKVVSGLNGPYGIAFGMYGEMIVTECNGHRLSIFDTRGQKIHTFGSRGETPDKIKYPRGVAIDDKDNIYVSSAHKLQKFSITGDFVRCVGQLGKGEGEFDDPRGVTLFNNEVYVSDRNNHRIQVFDLDLVFIKSIGSRGNHCGEFTAPLDVQFDTSGNMYVAELSNKRVQVINSNGQYVRAIGHDGEKTLGGPLGLYIADKYLYVSDLSRDCIAVYETSGQFVTSFGRHGTKQQDLCYSFCITSCTNGYVYVCYHVNDRIQIF